MKMFPEVAGLKPTDMMYMEDSKVHLPGNVPVGSQVIACKMHNGLLAQILTTEYATNHKCVMGILPGSVVVGCRFDGLEDVTYILLSNDKFPPIIEENTFPVVVCRYEDLRT